LELRVEIAGVEYRSTNRYQIVEQSGAVSTSTIDVRLDNAPPPVELSIIEIFDSSDTIFYAGIIQSIDFPEYSSAYETKIFHLTCVSLNCIFNNRLVSESYVDKYTHEIVEDLFDNYLLEEGLTKGTISIFTRKYNKYVSNRLKLSDVLSELGDAVGAIPIITPDRIFHFMEKTNFPVANAPTHIRALQKASNAQNLRTVQFLSGASEDTSLQIKSFIWTSGQTEIPLAYQVSSIVGITINATPVGVGIVGLDSGDATKTFLWKYGQQNIALNTTATVKPVTGDTVVCSYYGFYAIEIELKNDQLSSQIKALNGTSGKIEICNVDQTVTSLIDGEQAAADLLSINGEIEETVSLICHDASASSVLNTWSLSYPNLDIIGDYVIVERSISDFYGQFTVNVKLKNKGFSSRYGTIYQKNNKVINNLTVRTDDLVQRFNSFMDTFHMIDSWSLRDGGLICFPATGSDIIEPETLLGVFYPI